MSANKVLTRLPSGLVIERVGGAWTWKQLAVSDDGQAIVAMSSQAGPARLWLWTRQQSSPMVESPINKVCLLHHLHACPQAEQNTAELTAPSAKQLSQYTTSYLAVFQGAACMRVTLYAQPCRVLFERAHSLISTIPVTQSQSWGVLMQRQYNSACIASSDAALSLCCSGHPCHWP